MSDIGGPLGDVGGVGAIGGCQGCRESQGCIGAGRECKYPGARRV